METGGGAIPGELLNLAVNIDPFLLILSIFKLFDQSCSFFRVLCHQLFPLVFPRNHAFFSHAIPKSGNLLKIQTQLFIIASGGLM